MTTDSPNLFDAVERDKERLKAEAMATIEREFAEMLRLTEKLGYVPVKREEWTALKTELKQSTASIALPVTATSDAPPFDGTVLSLGLNFETDTASPFHGLRFRSKKYYRNMSSRVVADCAGRKLSELSAQEIMRLYSLWSGNGKHLTVGKGRVGMLRNMCNYGITRFGDPECARISGLISKMTFESPKPRDQRLTAEHVIAIRAKAHEMKLPSVALTQAVQFELGLQQVDVIGEWVPKGEPGISEVVSTDRAGRPIKWLRGLRWSEIDRDRMILRHTTSRQQERIEIDLKTKPMVMEELGRLGDLPSTGAMILDDATDLPYMHGMFRAIWRKVANAAGVPKGIKNMDSVRSGEESTADDDRRTSSRSQSKRRR